MASELPATFPNGFALTLRPDALDIPLRWKRPRTIFVNSMSDLFHVDVPEEYLQLVFDVMRRTTALFRNERFERQLTLIRRTTGIAETA